MKSKDYASLIKRLEEEIVRNRQYIKRRERAGAFEQGKVAMEYIKYHEEMIKFIKKLDGEME